MRRRGELGWLFVHATPSKPGASQSDARVKMPSELGASRPGGPGGECLSVQLVPRHGTPHQTKVVVVTTPFASAGAGWSEWKKLRAHRQTFQSISSAWTYGCTAKSKCFCNCCSAAWPFRAEPSSGHAVQTAAVCSVRELSW